MLEIIDRYKEVSESVAFSGSILGSRDPLYSPLQPRLLSNVPSASPSPASLSFALLLELQRTIVPIS